MAMKEHYFISDSDGALYDTRDAGWSSAPLRPNYKWHHSEIETVADLKATLRAGAYAWPGGYPLFFATADGAALSFTTARKEFRTIASAIADDDKSGGWRIEACGINFENGGLVCGHSGETIESAYGD